MKTIPLIGGGGFVGSVLRYWLSAWVFRIFARPWFPVGTLAVNLLGCLLIGLLASLAEQRRVFDPQICLFVVVGVLGGFTTFSAFAYETATLLRDERLFGARSNVGKHVFLGLAAVRLGGMLSRLG